MIAAFTSVDPWAILRPPCLPGIYIPRAFEPSNANSIRVSLSSANRGERERSNDDGSAKLACAKHVGTIEPMSCDAQT